MYELRQCLNCLFMYFCYNIFQRYNDTKIMQISFKFIMYIFDAVSEALPEINTNGSACERWSSVENIVKAAAVSTIGLTAPTGRRDTPHCPEMAAMSAEQRKLKLWRQNTRDVNNKAALKLQRNAILHAMRRKARSNAEERLDRMASEVERLHDGAKMFRALREMTRRPATQLTFHDDAGRIISNSAEINTRVTDHFSRQFTDPTVDGLDAFAGEPSQLTRPITPEEVTLAIGKLNTGRASGHDDIPAEFLKCSAELISHTIANIFNDALQHHELLDIGKGVLILVQKPGKPTGPLTSLRPIVLLSVLRKTLSLIVLSRIAPKVDEYLSSSQSGFRRGRSTADVVFGYRWLCAKAQRHRVTVKFLGIDLSRAFDTIRRDKLLDTLQTFLDESELRMIRFDSYSPTPHSSPVYQQAIAWHLQRLSAHRKETASARYCSLFTLKLLSVTFGHVSQRGRQKMPPYHSMWSTPTIRISSVHLGHSSTTLSASHRCLGRLKMSPDPNNSPTSHSANYGQCGSDVHTSVYNCVYDCMRRSLSRC